MAMTNNEEVIAAVQAGDVEKLRTLLAKNSALASARDANGVSAIMHSLYRHQAEMTKLLLAAGPELDIFEATTLGRRERVAELLQRDPALAKSWSPDGFTALHLACFFAQEETAILLLQAGADAGAEARNPMKVAPLHSAAAGHSVPIVKALLEHGAPPNARQQGGWTAMHEAAQRGDKPMVELLLKKGADRAAANDEGMTAVQLATKNGHAEVAKLLA